VPCRVVSWLRLRLCDDHCGCALELRGSACARGCARACARGRALRLRVCDGVSVDARLRPLSCAPRLAAPVVAVNHEA